ncbi:hypothetical protein ADK67_32515 [Saccharothrix sp. NRRL B-16348]|uniref:SAM-dependent methyltransferase n=1 Tax=Saccharothrix sp. NRRL B-16348 TaxID=1415542 RepID=UPI0006AF983F|nr:SAM-dependent methyltransferase [Saccharothrix sp. NRRL B-16348]KOX19800.1 hypothetical protein ADK67_32515 [Saccharothrix sp. NRRL B-16348]
MATQRGALGLDAPVDLDAPSLARIYDYLLGGGHNFAADRVVADKITALVPGYGVFIRENNTFRRRAVLHMLAAGIEQFLDVGTGVFSTRPLHHLAQAGNPDAHVVYVDRDPVVVAGLNLLVEQGDARTGVVEADLRHVDEVLDHAVTARLLDLSRPVGVVAGAVLHCLPDADDPTAAVARYYERLAPGSLLAASHADGTTLGLELAAAIEDCLAEAGITLVHRSEQRFADLLGPWQPHPDGVVPVGWWRPDSLTAPRPERSLGDAVMAGRRLQVPEQV